VPALLVTALAALAFGHALWHLESTSGAPGTGISYHIFKPSDDDDSSKSDKNMTDGKEFFFDLFSMLLTDQVNGEPSDWKAELVIYGSVVIFSVFFMNIFLGVIMEGYSIEKARWGQTLGRMRVHSSYTFLLRTKIIPANVLGTCPTRIILCLAIGLSIAFQYVATHFTKESELGYVPWYTPYVIFVLYGTILFCSYQNLTGPICPLQRRTETNYLWTCVPRDSNMNADEGLQEENAYLRKRISELEGHRQANRRCTLTLNQPANRPTRLESAVCSVSCIPEHEGNRRCTLPNQLSDQPTSTTSQSTACSASSIANRGMGENNMADEEMGLQRPTLLTGAKMPGQRISGAKGPIIKGHRRCTPPLQSTVCTSSVHNVTDDGMLDEEMGLQRPTLLTSAKKAVEKNYVAKELPQQVLPDSCGPDANMGWWINSTRS